MTDPAEIRAEGRRLLAETTKGPWHQMAAAAWSGTNEDPNLVADCPLYADAIAIVWLRNHADVLLADPAPEGLSEEERIDEATARTIQLIADIRSPAHRQFLATNLIDRLSASTRPAPVGLSEGERHVVERSRKLRQMGHRLMVSGDDLIGILDAHFPPSTSTEEGTDG